MYRIILGKKLGEKREDGIYNFDFKDFNEALVFVKKVIESGYTVSLEFIKM